MGNVNAKLSDVDAKLSDAVNKALNENSSLSIKQEPQTDLINEPLTNVFTNEQKKRIQYQPILMSVLIAILILQLIFMNKLYSHAISILLSIRDVNIEKAELYFDMYKEILNSLKFFTASTLCEFVAVFYFIIKWGFNSFVTQMYSESLKERIKGKNSKRKDKPEKCQEE